MLMIRPICPTHRRQRQPCGVKRRRQIDRQDRVPFLDRKLFERRNVLDAGIVDQNIEPPVTGDDRRDHLGDRVTAGHVSRGITDIDAEIGGQLVFGPVDLGRNAKAVQHHRRAGVRQRAGNPEPDAAGRARDKRDLAGQPPLCRNTLRFELDIHGRPFGWGDSAPYADHLRPNLPGRLHSRKYRLASKTIGRRYGGSGVTAGRDRIR